jgi:hypothetical protein
MVKNVVEVDELNQSKALYKDADGVNKHWMLELIKLIYLNYHMKKSVSSNLYVIKYELVLITWYLHKIKH